MFGHLVSPPPELYDDWPNATDADKAEIAGFYEKYGWKLVRAEVVAGAVDFVWEWLYEADRIAGAQTSREAFVGLLSSEQRQTWDQIQAKQTIYAVNGKYTSEQERESAERQRVFQQFKSTFTAEQTAAFDNMSRRGYSAPKKPDGKEPEVTLPRLTATDPATPGGPVPYTRAWINSKANPMLQQVESFPRELTQHWATLSLADRTQVVEYYQKHGWQLLHLETVGGMTSSFSWQNIYGDERAAVLEAKREAFFNLLTPEQRRAYRGGPISQIVPTLDARQRAAYEEMQDFTQADWN
ncbi:MAG: hypothetical protein IAF94_02035 [Pirellulaceae bacterium]|nr:hypothetical protein [Pirellulaceae bacterium]